MESVTEQSNSQASSSSQSDGIIWRNTAELILLGEESVKMTPLLPSRAVQTVLVSKKERMQLKLTDTGWVILRPKVAKQSTHPLGIRDYIPEEPAVGSSCDRTELWSRLLGDSRVYILNSVAPSTMDQYKVGVKKFLEFCPLFGTNRTLTMRPPEWHVNTDLHIYSFMEVVAMSFLAYLRSDHGIEPKSAINYMSAVRKFWINCNLDVREIDQSVFLANVRSGMVRLWRAKEGIRESDRLTLPYSVDMIMYMFMIYFPNYRRGPLIENAVCVANMVGYSIVARQGEYLYTPAAKVHHHLTAREGVRFELLNDGQKIVVGADQTGPYNLDQMQWAFISVQTAKNDSEGAGNRFPFKKLDLEFIDTEAAFFVATELFLLSKRLHLRPKAPFFSSSVEQENWALTAEVLNYHMRKVADQGFGIRSKKISSHSLRVVGAASALANGGVPDYIIQKIGRWKSLVILQYIRMARGSFELAQKVLLDRNNFNVEDVRHWHPGAVHLLENVVPEDYSEEDNISVSSYGSSANEYWPPL